MDLRGQLLKEHSKANCDLVVAWVGRDPQRLGSLMQLFLHDEYRVVQRSAQVVSHVADHWPEGIQPHVPELVKRMQEPGLPVAVKRNVVRILQFLELPEEVHGDVMNTCFDLLADVRETIAVRVFSMTVLARLAITYPDIRPELRALIEDGLEHDPSPGFRSRAGKVLSAL